MDGSGLSFSSAYITTPVPIQHKKSSGRQCNFMLEHSPCFSQAMSLVPNTKGKKKKTTTRDPGPSEMQTCLLT